MNCWIKYRCNCGIKKVEVEISKKRFIDDSYFLKCDKCRWRCEILSVKNEREWKIDTILEKIKED